MHFKHNLFKVPAGQAGKAFVKELSRLFLNYGESSALECIALKAAFTLPALVLQRPNPRSKPNENSKCLLRRLDLWRQGQISVLLAEGRAIQNHLSTSPLRHHATEDKARRFCDLVKVGKLKAAQRLLQGDGSGKPLSLTQEVKESLQAKHPPRQPPSPDAILPKSLSMDEANSHLIVFDQIDGKLIHKSALKSDGAAGPSGLDASMWKRLLSSFGSYSSDLCNAVAAVTRRLCSTCVDPANIEALVASRLIALDKCPGVRPIGVGEVVRRVMGRAILAVLKDDIMRAVGPLQLCAGQEAGCEAAIHAIHQIFDDPSTDAVLQVDATNAFNSLNRETALRNIQVSCPAIATILTNTYRQDIPLFIGGETIFSREGTTQGDPLAMAMYALAVSPLIKDLRDDGCKQVWYADDSSAGGRLDKLEAWWESLQQRGPAYGYFPNPNKSWLIVKEDRYEEAKEKFRNSGLNITSDGRRHLGSTVGTDTFTEAFVRSKVVDWVQEIEELSVFAKTQPHAVFAVFTHCTIHKWSFLSRTTPEVSDLLRPLEDAIQVHLLPALTGRDAVGPLERELIALPARLGGLGIPNPALQAPSAFQNSKEVSGPLTSLIIEQSSEISQDTAKRQSAAKSELKKRQLDLAKTKQQELMEKMPTTLKRAVEVASEKGASTWLTAIPLAEHGFLLSKGEFHDALHFRFGWQPSRLPRTCVCGKAFTIDHSVICSYGGFPSLRHNELRDITAKLMTQVCHNVGTEPALQPLSGEILRMKSSNREDGARLDVVADNFWGDGQRAFFDVRVFHPMAQSYRQTRLNVCYKSREQEKRRCYEERIREVERGTFAPLVFTTAGGMAPVATVVYKRLASMIAERKKQPYHLTINLIRCQISFALIRSAVRCLRGFRSSRGNPGSCGTIEDFQLANAESQIDIY